MTEITVDPRCAGEDPEPDDARDRNGSTDAMADLVDAAGEPTLEVALRAVREMLGMDVAYVSEIVGGNMILRELEGDGQSFGIARNGSMPLEQTYCQRMLDGRIPNLIPDVLADDRTASLPITTSADVGAFATVPLTFADGRLYGTLCAASHEAKPLDYRELQFLRVFARLIADQLERQAATVALRELAALVNAADDAIMGLTLEGVVTSWNAASQRLLGRPADQAIGRNIVDLIALPEGEKGMRRALAKASAGEVVHWRGRRPRADGDTIYYAVTLSPVRDDQGEVCFISAVSRDISETVLQTHYRAVEREVVSSLAGAADAAEATMGILRGLGEGLDCQIAALWELDDHAQSLWCSGLWTSGRADQEIFAAQLRDDSFVCGEELPGRIWAHGDVVWLEGLDRIADSARIEAAAAAGLRTAVGIPLRLGGEVIGVVEFFSANQTPENADMLAMGQALVGRLADALGRHRAQEALRDANQALEVRVHERTTDLQHAVAELDAAQIETVRRLSRAVEFRDHDTGAHIARISAFAMRTARRAGLDAERCRLIERASPLHDVGKVAIPDSVLLKPGPLTRAERSIIENHAEIGHRLLEGSDSAVIQLAATIALTHHEHYDDDGYPRGLAGDEIPIEGRIVAIADVFDALTSDRIYRPAMSIDQALVILRAGRGTHFDPALLDHFFHELRDGDTA